MTLLFLYYQGFDTMLLEQIKVVSKQKAAKTAEGS